MKNRDLIFSFDVGHSSIGWNVLQETDAGPNELALGTVTFESDGCLASKRRVHRGMRRNIRSRRLRIEDIEKLFVHQGILTEKQVDDKHQPGSGDSAPWLLATAVLAGNGAYILNPDELFDVIRWYAHNRGYDGNRRWAGNVEDEEGDSNREKAAFALMDQHKTTTMAETICAQLGLTPDGHKKASMTAYKDSEIGAAFPRKTVIGEVTQILNLHIGKVDGCTESFVKALCGEDDDAWKAISVEGLKKPKTYRGGLLFGQKVPRFDNRILSFCPVSDSPAPLKSCAEFMEFRGAMFLSNVRVGSDESFELRPLSVDELKELWARFHEHGYMTAAAFKTAVRSLEGVFKDNLETLFTIDAADKNLVVDPALKLISTKRVLLPLTSLMPESTREDVLFKLRKKHGVTVRELIADIPESEELTTALEAAFKKESKKVQEKYGSQTRWIEKQSFAASFDSGRAPYSRAVMKKAVQEILEGKDPRAKDGCLYLTEEMMKRQERYELDKLTNNHLVRHRLLILRRLFRDMVDEFCDGDKSRILSVVVEVNREVSEMSGMNAQERKKVERRKRQDHEAAKKKLLEVLEERDLSAGLIRKARIAQDQGWKCPYTGKEFEPLDLIHKQVDLDHIIPRSERLSDSMAGLVVTFSEINRWKGARTAYQFVSEEQGKKVKGKPNLSIQSLKAYETFVSKLKVSGGHDADVARRKSRKGYLMLPSYQDKEFTPRDLTISSYVAKLAAQQIKKEFSDLLKKPAVISLPGRLTGEARKSWKLLGLLSAVNEKIGSDTPKNDIRGLTHLHHALDAAVMGLMAHYADNLSDGTTWQLLLKRNLSAEEKNQLKANMQNVEFDSRNRAHLKDVPREIKEQLRKCLMERRVVQHVPSSMDGLKVDQNTSGIIGVDEKTGKVKLHQGGKPTEPCVPGKLLGYGINGSKLNAQKGVRIIDANFGVAICDVPEVIRWHKVFCRLSEIKERYGKWPVVWRKGHILCVPDGRQAGIWRISGVDENARDGIIVKLRTLDGFERAREARIKSLLKSEARLVNTGLIGDGICRITSSISTVHP